jgi:hypothetical protein
MAYALLNRFVKRVAPTTNIPPIPVPIKLLKTTSVKAITDFPYVGLKFIDI